MTTFLNVYLIDRAYGGPEEGGWWYTCGYGRRSIPVSCPRVEERLRPRIQKVLDGWNRGRRSDISSVISEGRYEILKENHPATDFPSRRPYYE